MTRRLATPGASGAPAAGGLLWRDALRPPGPARRIVSLVPSVTEMLFALELGPRVVGVTEWCVHPAAGVAPLPKLGGTKTPDLDALRALSPDLVIANQEENRRRDIEALAAELRVWLTYPRTVKEGAALFAAVAGLGASPAVRRRVLAPVRAALARAQSARAQPARPAPVRVFCPIWKNPWMSVGADTYAGDLLALCGGRNIFGAPGGPEGRRYPLVSQAQIVAAAPEVVLLPSEPYAFGPGDAAELRELPIPAARSGRIHLIDGTLVSWYGPRIGRSIETLCALLGSPQ
ncbi:MAG: helical backbone metal receptor [Deltaproteobacteria bacterium]|nr:helical backbone metal receptor [Deltaproteobacteria bacterium]